MRTGPLRIMCWRRADAHHKTSVFEWFNCSRLVLIHRDTSSIHSLWGRWRRQIRGRFPCGRWIDVSIDCCTLPAAVHLTARKELGLRNKKIDDVVAASKLMDWWIDYSVCSKCPPSARKHAYTLSLARHGEWMRHIGDVNDVFLHAVPIV